MAFGQVAKQLIRVGVNTPDVAGAGGTSWSQVEAHRARTQLQKKIAESFIHWGIPTRESLRQVQDVSKDVPIIASGGIHSGIDAAKALHCGAQCVGMAGKYFSTPSKTLMPLSQKFRAQSSMKDAH